MASLLTATAIGLVGNLATGTVHVTGAWVPVTWIGTGFLVATAVVLLLVEARTVPRDQTAVLDSAVAALTAAVARQWKHEVVLRGVRQPIALRVHWRSTGRPVAASRDVVMDEPNTDWVEQPLAGELPRSWTSSEN